MSKLTDELYTYGAELRNDWSGFDGRDARDRLSDIAERIEQKVRKALNNPNNRPARMVDSDTVVISKVLKELGL